MKRVRITGAGAQIGPFGASLQWEYLGANEAVARRVLVDLEDRRILFHSHGREDPEFCRRSADEIRHLMTRELSGVVQGDDMDRALRAIRNAARAFVERAGPDSEAFRSDFSAFVEALEVMRRTMSPHIRSMARAYDILLDHVLDESLPPHGLDAAPFDN